MERSVLEKTEEVLKKKVETLEKVVEILTEELRDRDKRIMDLEEELAAYVAGCSQRRPILRTGRPLAEANPHLQRQHKYNRLTSLP